jgi:hypothetical protein
MRSFLYYFKPPFPSAGRSGPTAPPGVRSRTQRLRMPYSGNSRRIQAGRWTAGQLHCETSLVAPDAALKGPLRRPPAALDRCLLLTYETAPFQAPWGQVEAGSGRCVGQIHSPLGFVQAQDSCKWGPSPLTGLSRRGHAGKVWPRPVQVRDGVRRGRKVLWLGRLIR